MRTSHVQTLPIVLSRQSRVSLPQQVGEELKRLILEGYFKPGAIMPSSRTLCETLQVGRSTIIEAFEQLKFLIAAG
ncbi:MAG TPA: FadR family transcriptional regulator [Candidatus Melainabacteria bacterium]|nr:FadR family transcriptional regulator [Candidatus Melainabacteria bacterium]